VISPPTNGAAEDNGAGAFLYTPASGFSGVDSFGYIVCDDDSLCDTATVSVTVINGDPPPTPSSLVSMVPARLLETRFGPNEVTIDHLFEGIGRQGAGTTLELQVTNRGGVPADADAVMLNVTAVFPDAPGFLTVFPCGSALPKASNVNYGPGDVVANAVLAKVGAGGKVCIYTLAVTDVVVDVNGYVPG